jgi:predicted unusual protein kinase regulating ubiquinone biosynthesis (AarF/ABC1/UbiB family)
MTFLHDTVVSEKTWSKTNWIWNCISVALAPVREDKKILPSTVQQVTDLTWNGYCRANRRCDGTLMARYFHDTCRLTYSSSASPNNNNDDDNNNNSREACDDDDGDDRYHPSIVICESDAFYDKVQHRYENEAMHQPYRHLRDDPDVGNWDRLRSIEFATPELAMVVLDVGHPPCLWTDLLTCARIRSPRHEDDDDDHQAKWWIVHKSSESEPHPLSHPVKKKGKSGPSTVSAAVTLVCTMLLLQLTGVQAFSLAITPRANLISSRLSLRNVNNRLTQLLVSGTAGGYQNETLALDATKDDQASGWWSFTFPTISFQRQIEFPSIEVPDPIVMIQATHEKYLESLQIVKKRRVFQRMVEITAIMCGQILRPVLCSVVDSRPDLSTIHIPTDEDWDTFWREKRGPRNKKLSNAERVAQGIPTLGPTFVKLALILATRPDILPIPLAEALGDLHYNVPPFDDVTAKRMIRTDLKSAMQSQEVDVSQYFESKKDIDTFMKTLSKKPIATGGIAQVYKGYLPGFGDVAVKVLRPGVRRKVERDITLFHSTATWAEKISNSTMKLPGVNLDIGSIRLVEAVDEFTSRVLEDMDFKREAENMKAFASLYDSRRGTSPTVKIVVPEVISELSSNRIIVMEWLRGTRLTEVCDDCDEREKIEKENLMLIVQAIEMTVSQLIDHGLLHGDPNLAHVLKVVNPKTGKSEIGYIDFGIVSYVPQNFRDAIVCAVTQLVFARNLNAIADLLGEMQLLPQETVTDPTERERLLDALQTTVNDLLIWPKNKKGVSTGVPTIRFENVLPALSKFIQSFEFTMPPYFLNNVRALAALEGMAIKLDPNFNVLRVIYPYSINRLMRNPTVSENVQNTFLDICRNPETKLISPRRVQMLLNDWALWTGYRKRKIFWDLATSAGGRRVAPVIFKNFLLNRARNIKALFYKIKFGLLRSGRRALRLLSANSFRSRRKVYKYARRQA